MELESAIRLCGSRNSYETLPMKTAIAQFLIVLLFACLGSWQNAQAVSPAPDGGYGGGNTAEGTSALFFLTTGVWNTALGYQTLFHLTTGNQNTATGFQALINNTGDMNVANGSQALFHNTTASFDTATGCRALYSNSTGNDNTADGFEALRFNTTGFDNTAIGYQALNKNTTAGGNTATGSQALYSNTTGGGANTANGIQALYHNTTGVGNTAIGAIALMNNTTGNSNTAAGIGALPNNRSGDNNTAIGTNTLQNAVGSNNVAFGFNAGSSIYLGSNNVVLGANAGTYLQSGSNNIYLGAAGQGSESNTMRLGRSGTQTRAFIAGVSDTAVAGATVVVDSNGQLGVATSSARFKDNIKAMDKTSESILALKPVTFRYKKDIDPKSTAQFGLVAEEVEKINPDLVARNAKGELYTVRYEAVNAMLLNEFLKEHRKVQEQDATIAQVKLTAAKQESTIAQQQKQIEALTAGLQKVSTQLEAGRPAPQVVNNP